MINTLHDNSSEFHSANNTNTQNSNNNTPHTKQNKRVIKEKIEEVDINKEQALLIQLEKEADIKSLQIQNKKAELEMMINLKAETMIMEKSLDKFAQFYLKLLDMNDLCIKSQLKDIQKKEQLINIKDSLLTSLIQSSQKDICISIETISNSNNLSSRHKSIYNGKQKYKQATISQRTISNYIYPKYKAIPVQKDYYKQPKMKTTFVAATFLNKRTRHVSQPHLQTKKLHDNKIQQKEQQLLDKNIQKRLKKHESTNIPRRNPLNISMRTPIKNTLESKFNISRDLNDDNTLDMRHRRKKNGNVLSSSMDFKRKQLNRSVHVKSSEIRYKERNDSNAKNNSFIIKQKFGQTVSALNISRNISRNYVSKKESTSVHVIEKNKQKYPCEIYQKINLNKSYLPKKKTEVINHTQYERPASNKSFNSKLKLINHSFDDSKIRLRNPSTGKPESYMSGLLIRLIDDEKNKHGTLYRSKSQKNLEGNDQLHLSQKKIGTPNMSFQEGSNITITTALNNNSNNQHIKKYIPLLKNYNHVRPKICNRYKEINQVMSVSIEDIEENEEKVNNPTELPSTIPTIEREAKKTIKVNKSLSQTRIIAQDQELNLSSISTNNNHKEISEKESNKNHKEIEVLETQKTSSSRKRLYNRNKVQSVSVINKLTQPTSSNITQNPSISTISPHQTKAKLEMTHSICIDKPLNKGITNQRNTKAIHSKQLSCSYNGGSLTDNITKTKILNKVKESQMIRNNSKTNKNNKPKVYVPIKKNDQMKKDIPKRLFISVLSKICRKVILRNNFFQKVMKYIRTPKSLSNLQSKTTSKNSLNNPLQLSIDHHQFDINYNGKLIAVDSDYLNTASIKDNSSNNFNKQRDIAFYKNSLSKIKQIAIDTKQYERSLKELALKVNTLYV